MHVQVLGAASRRGRDGRRGRASGDLPFCLWQLHTAAEHHRACWVENLIGWGLCAGHIALVATGGGGKARLALLLAPLWTSRSPWCIRRTSQSGERSREAPERNSKPQMLRLWGRRGIRTAAALPAALQASGRQLLRPLPPPPPPPPLPTLLAYPCYTGGAAVDCGRPSDHPTRSAGAAWAR